MLPTIVFRFETQGIWLNLKTQGKTRKKFAQDYLLGAFSFIGLYENKKYYNAVHAPGIYKVIESSYVGSNGHKSAVASC